MEPGNQLAGRHGLLRQLSCQRGRRQPEDVQHVPQVVRDHRQDIVPLTHGPACRLERSAALGLGRHARRYVTRRDGDAFDFALLSAQRGEDVLVLGEPAGRRDLPRVLDRLTGGEGQAQHPLELRAVPGIPAQLLPGAAQHACAVEAHRAGAAFARIDVPAGRIEGIEMVRRRFQQRFEEPHPAAKLDDPKRQACSGTECIDMVWSKRARHAIHDGEYADLYRPFAQRRYRQELRAGSRCELGSFWRCSALVRRRLPHAGAADSSTSHRAGRRRGPPRPFLKKGRREEP